MRLALPALKADYRAFDAYACTESVRIAAPIHAMGGDQDPVITLGDIYAWRTHSDDVTITLFDGGHFFFHDYVDDIAELLTPGTRCGQTS